MIDKICNYYFWNAFPIVSRAIFFFQKTVNHSWNEDKKNQNLSFRNKMMIKETFKKNFLLQVFLEIKQRESMRD